MKRLVLFASLALAACGDAPTGEAETRASPAPAVDAAASPAPAAVTDKAEATRIARDRHKRFEEIGKAFKAINGQLKSASPDVGAIAGHASLIHRYAPQVPSWFPAGTGPQDGVRTDARAEVWQEPDRFRKAAAGLVAPAARLAEAAKGGDLEAVRAAVKPLGQACKTCHDRFREEDEKH